MSVGKRIPPGGVILSSIQLRFVSILYSTEREVHSGVAKMISRVQTSFGSLQFPRLDLLSARTISQTWKTGKYETNNEPTITFCQKRRQSGKETSERDLDLTRIRPKAENS